MEVFLKTALYIHIVSGGLALCGGLIAMLARKGKKLHRYSGKVFYFSMLAVTVSAILLAIFKDSKFLLHIGIMALYMNVSGFRAVKRPDPLLFFDWLLIVMGAANGVWMISSGNLILIIFGAISLFLVILDLVYFRMIKTRGFDPSLRFTRHIRLMLGAYIATSTAFLVVNVSEFKYPVLLWLLPTIMITPLIIYWSGKYSKRRRITPA